jgi:hydroxypyruvate isomerase
MPRFAANLSMLYNEHAFVDRFAAAAADGFNAVEYLFPYAVPAADLASGCSEHGLTAGAVQRPARQLGCRRARPGLPARARGRVPPRHRRPAPAYAAALSCQRVHVMAGLVPAGADRGALRDTYLANLAWAAAQAAPHGVQVLIEPINTRDIPGFFLNRQDEAHAIVQAVGAPNLKVQFDLYHCQIVEGDLAMKIRQYLPAGRVGHFQIAGVPERHEPDLGELHHPYLFSLLDSLGWDGFVGCEYRPRDTRPGGTSAGLGWLRAWRASQSA